MSEPVISERALGDCQYRHDWIGGRCNTCGCRMDWDELNQKACAAEAKVAELTPLLSNAIRERNKYDAECDRLEAKVEELEQEKEEMRKVLENSEQYRRAYQAGKIELYSMGEPFTGAAMQHLPCGEGELDRRFTKLIEMPRLVAQQSLIRELEQERDLFRRLYENKYLPWQEAGGPNACAHGVATGIACWPCDIESVRAYTSRDSMTPCRESAK